MNTRQSPLFWSFGVGTWFATRIRISVFFPLLAFMMAWSLGWELGLTLCGLMFVSTLLHEFGHVFGARATGGDAQEILIWPLGGLAFVEPARTFQSQFLTTLAGPFVNLCLCALTIVPMLSGKHVAAAWNPLFVPIGQLSGDWFADICLLVFWINWMQLLINLMPVFPLDGGRMLQVWLSLHWGPVESAQFSIRVGFIAALVMGVVAFLGDATWLLGLAFLVLILTLMETQRVQSGEAYDDSFMGYDFSQGYTSLERSQTAIQQEPKPSLFQRWRQRRREEKRKRQEQQEQQAEVQLDAILAKLHEQGMQSLSEAEKKQLEKASARYRGKSKPPS